MFHFFLARILILYNSLMRLGLVLDPVIEAIAKQALVQKSSLEAAGAIVVATSSPGLIPSLSLGAGWSRGQYGFHMDPCQTKLQHVWFCASVLFKLQMSC